ncbi:MAG TPA: Yip1 family protein [Thermoanaerobaculia bacterium]
MSTPGSTMADVADRPDWLVPFLLILVLSVGLNFVAAPHLDIETGLREQLTERGLSDQQIDDAVDRVAVFQKFGAPIAAVTVTILLIALAALYMLATRVMGGEGTFKQFFAVTNYAWLPQLLKGILVTFLLVRAGSVEPEQMGALLKSNLGFLADPKEQGELFAVLSGIDVFNFAALALMIFGYGRASKLGTQKTAVIVIATYVVWIGARVGMAALRG